jgi:hypothetical protein
MLVRVTVSFQQPATSIGRESRFLTELAYSKGRFPVADRFPVLETDKWTFHLHLTDTLEFHITPSESGEGDHVRVDGHDISLLLDYLYDHREIIYEATHDEARRRTEALEALEALSRTQQRGRIEPIRYVDDDCGCR